MNDYTIYSADTRDAIIDAVVDMTMLLEDYNNWTPVEMCEDVIQYFKTKGRSLNATKKEVLHLLLLLNRST